jgi:carbamoyltransferase
MNILGIHDGHNCGATLVQNGVVIASVCEERLSRCKNEVGYPKLSIDDVMRLSKVSVDEIDAVVFASLFMHYPEYLLDIKPWYRVGIEDQNRDADKTDSYKGKIFDVRKKERISDVCTHLGIHESKISFVEHHTAHLAAAYYTAPSQHTEPVLGLTCDGAGDGVSATVSICEGNKINRIATTNRHASLGKIFSRVTMMMGMKPWEHEYKLMGLAPYADSVRTDRATEVLKNLLYVDVDNLTFKQKGDLSMNYIYDYLHESFREVRFDVIAAATQKFTEELLIEWVIAAIKKTGIRRLVCGGGVFMNVKANMLIAQLPEVDSMYVMPSGGDESLSIGAALHYFYQNSKKVDYSASSLGHLYLGGLATDEDKAIESLRMDSNVEISSPVNIDEQVAELLSKGRVVARCRGPMEWGARSLGNRSILCSAENYSRVDYINKMIKVRDFWMPFAPSILEESASRYFDDPKELKPWFMTFGYPVREKSYDDLTAASHPRDHTIRPQVVTKEANPGYHNLISHFEFLTGRGVILNTSFNLHGEPIVYSAKDAVRVFLKSGLEYLALDNYLLKKLSVDKAE